MSVLNLNHLLEKTGDWDKDERYMATSDLCNELQKDIKIDSTMERRICAAVLKQLDDTSNDVQSIAVKCLGILLKKVQETQVGEICDKLCTLILEGKPELLDIYSIGLKTLISDVPEMMGSSVAQRLTLRLLAGVQQDDNVEIKLQCLDNLTDLLKRFGREVEGEHDSLMGCALSQLCHTRHVVRKRATACLGTVAVVASDSLLNRLTETLLTQIEAPTGGNDVRTLIQTIGTISRTVGFRLGRHLDRVVPLFLRFCGDPADEDQHTEQVSELRENCFQGFESFVLRCPREVAPHLPEIVKVSLAFTKYDPNYSYGDSDEEDADAAMGGDDDDEGFSDGDIGGSDDDDSSWKVRRSAIKVLSSVISCRPELLQELYELCASDLINRFKEREENVRVDIIKCFETLLDATISASSRTKGKAKAKIAGVRERGFSDMEIGEVAGDTSGVLNQTATINELRRILGSIIRVSEKQLKGTSQKTRVAVFAMLRKLCQVLNGGLEDHMEVLSRNLRYCLVDKNQGLKLEALLFLRLVMESHRPADTQPLVSGLLPLVVDCANEDWYKIIAEALRVISQIVHVIRPRSKEGGRQVLLEGYNYGACVELIYKAVLPRLEAHDIDQEIKECAILAVGSLLAFLGDQLSASQRASITQLLMDRLRNEITRMPTLKSLEAAALSPLNLDLGPILCEAVEELAYFLRQQSRTLKQTTLETLDALITHNSSALTGDLFSLVLRESAGLLTDTDLHLAHLGLRVVTSVLNVSPGATKAAEEHVLPRALILAASPLLQGLALSSLLSLFRELVATGADGLSFEELSQQLQGLAETDAGGRGVELPKQAVANLAKCLAALASASSLESRQALLKQLVFHMDGGGTPMQKHLALLCIGELGCQVDLSDVPKLDVILMQTFESGQEEEKTAAAYALGHMAVGNMPTYLPLILSALSDSRHQYLLLAALKEVIVCHALDSRLDFSDHVDEVLPHLYRHCETPEEGVRNMVAECLGALSSMHPSKVVSGLLELTNDGGGDAFRRWTVVTALKYSVSHGSPVASLMPHMPQFLIMLRDEDLDVRKACLLFVNAAAHHQPALIAELLSSPIMPVICETIELRLERVVDLGPFKHKVDDGLPLRKAALSCVDTVLDMLPERLDVVGFMPFLASGLGDSQPDVQQLCHQILMKVAAFQAGAVLGSLDSLVDPLEKTVNKRVKDTQVGSEVERANDLIRSALRAIVAIKMIEDANSSRQFTLFMERLEKKGSDKIQAMLQGILAEQNM